jgi:hypothetical protein
MIAFGTINVGTAIIAGGIQRRSARKPLTNRERPDHPSRERHP